MPRNLIIADDLTGAAEIAGIAARFGLTTQLLRTPAPPPLDCDVVVYDTDTRLLPRAEAVARVMAFAKAGRAARFDLVFKKTDSVLRGEPHAEIDAVASVFKRSDVLWVPQNPSRGRCITDGIYRVDGVPLHETDFARDPLHPATSSRVYDLLRETRDGSFRCVPPRQATTPVGFVIGEATTLDDVAIWAGQLNDERQIAAGGADFFEALIARRNGVKRISPSFVRRPLLYVRGTASGGSIRTRDRLACVGRVAAMPPDVFIEGVAAVEAFNRWTDIAISKLRHETEIMLSIEPPDGRAGNAHILQTAMAAACESVIAAGDVRTIACEGGATSAAVCERLGWRHFVIEAEIASGVVMLCFTPAAPRLIVKPGSYAWPDLSE